MFKKADEDFFSKVDIIQKFIIFLIVGSLVGGIILCFVDFTCGILMATVLPALLIVLSLILYMITHVAIDAKIARNKACGEDVTYLLELLDIDNQSKPEKPNPNQKYIDMIMSHDDSDSQNKADVNFVDYEKNQKTQNDTSSSKTDNKVNDEKD